MDIAVVSNYKACFKRLVVFFKGKRGTEASIKTG
jgi:hypothetical protein